MQIDLLGGLRGEWVPGQRDRAWAVVIAVTLPLAMVLTAGQIMRDVAADDARHSVNGMMRIHADSSGHALTLSPGD